MKVKEICNIMDRIAPVSLAYEWDNVGLLVGDYNGAVSKIMLSLDCSEAIIDECIKERANMIITHHPIIFTPIKKVNNGDLVGRLIIKLIENGISLYSAHTNLDISKYGPNDAVAKLFRSSYTQFLNVIKEENNIAIEGLGKVITLKSPLTLKSVLEIVKKGLQLETIRYTGDINQTINKIAILTGTGMSYYKNAKSLDADVFLTSDIKYHEAQDSLWAGLPLIDITHFHSERAVLYPLKDKIESLLSEDMEIIISKKEENPFSYFL